MKACIQRVRRAQVTIDGALHAQIAHGMLVLLGVAAGDGADDAAKLARKIVGLRIFEDAAEKMNLALADSGGAMLVVSQFTLLADCRKGRRPSFTAAAAPAEAERLYERFCDQARAAGVTVVTGRFRANMQVELVNDGPVTLLVDSNELAD